MNNYERLVRQGEAFNFTVPERYRLGRHAMTEPKPAKPDSHPPTRENIQITSLYGTRGRQGLVQLDWGNKTGQLTVDEARRHGLAVIESAAAAEFDEVLAEELKDVGASEKELAVLMLELRRLLRESEGAWTETMALDEAQIAAIRVAQKGAEARIDKALSAALDKQYGSRGLTLLQAVRARREARYPVAGGGVLIG